MVLKYIKDGKVAVIYSVKGEWSRGNLQKIYHPETAKKIEQGDHPNTNLRIRWLPMRTQFVIQIHITQFDEVYEDVLIVHTA